MPEPEPAQASLVSRPPASGARGVCLVVDDSRVVRRIARSILEGLGFAVEEAADGAEALAACRRAMPRAILLDWNMPVMNGIEFLRTLKQEYGEAAAPVVFCTTETEMGCILEAIQSGASEYIMKPFDAEIVASKFGQAGLL